MTNPSRGSRKTRVGTVISGAMSKTVIVEVGRVKRHPKYDKVMRATTRCYVHDEKGEAAAGDLARIEECRPMSRLKRWRLVEIVKKGAVVAGPGAEEEVRRIEESIRGAKPQAHAPAAREGKERAAADAGEAGDAPGGAAK